MRTDAFRIPVTQALFCCVGIMRTVLGVMYGLHNKQSNPAMCVHCAARAEQATASRMSTAHLDPAHKRRGCASARTWKSAACAARLRYVASCGSSPICFSFSAMLLLLSRILSAFTPLLGRLDTNACSLPPVGFSSSTHACSRSRSSSQLLVLRAASSLAMLQGHHREQHSSWAAPCRHSRGISQPASQPHGCNRVTLRTLAILASFRL